MKTVTFLCLRVILIFVVRKRFRPFDYDMLILGYTAAVSVGRKVGGASYDFVDDLHTLDYVAKARILSVEVRCIADADKELTGGGVVGVTSCHRYRASYMAYGIGVTVCEELALYKRAAVASARPLRTAALYHKA